MQAALLEFPAVVVDELAGEDYKTLLACLEALIEKNGELCREACGRDIVLLAGAVIDDAGLGGVRCDVLKIRRDGDLLDRIPVLVRVVAGIDNGDHALAVDLLSVLGAAKVQGIQTLLLVDKIRQALGDGLHQSNLAVPVGLLIGHVEPVIDEGAKEVALTELQHLDRCALLDVSGIAGLLQDVIIEFLCHDLIPLFITGRNISLRSRS